MSYLIPNGQAQTQLPKNSDHGLSKVSDVCVFIKNKNCRERDQWGRSERECEQIELEEEGRYDVSIFIFIYTMYFEITCSHYLLLTSPDPTNTFPPHSIVIIVIIIISSSSGSEP